MKAFVVLLLLGSSILIGSLATAQTHDATVVHQIKSEYVIPVFEFEYTGVTYLPWDVCPLAPDTVGTVAIRDGFTTVEEKPPILGLGTESL